MDKKKHSITITSIRNKVIKIRKSKDQTSATTSDWLLVFQALIEVIIICILIILNSEFRYNDDVKTKNDLLNTSRVLVTCDSSKLKYYYSYPYYSYDVNSIKPLDGLQLKYELPESVFYIFVVLLPILMICLLEGIALLSSKSENEIQIFSIKIPNRIRTMIRILCAFLLGLFITGLLVSVFKFNLVSPRPHFMSVCFKDNSEFYPKSCKGKETNLWNPFIECSNQRTADILEALKSFPSYHAALAVYSGVFTSAYIFYGLPFRSLRSLSMVFVACLLILMFMGSTHRLESFHSFPTDVFWGGVIGLILAYFTVKIRLKSFREKGNNLKVEDKTSNNLDEEKNSKDKPSTSVTSDSDLQSESSSSDEYEEVKHPVRGLSPVFATAGSLRGSAITPTSSLPRRTYYNPTPPRSSSSVSRTWTSRPYNQPRQRNSAPAFGSTSGHINYGFDRGGSAPRVILSAYQPQRGQESLSQF